MFNYYQPTRIHFGAGRTNEIGSIAVKYGKKCLLVTTADAPLLELNNRVIGYLKDSGLEVVHFDQVKPNPTKEIVQAGILQAQEGDVDFIVAVGGGSSIDTAKAIAFTAKMDQVDWDSIFDTYSSHDVDYPSTGLCLPILSIPTTSGTGSHVTQAAVISSGEEKLTFFHPDLFSKEAIIDPSLMTTLPLRMTSATAFDTFTHAFESYVNGRGSYYSKLDSVNAMELVIENLPKALEEPKSLVYRENLALADTLGGKALANGGADTPHPLSEIIGGITNITHGDALAIVYPAYIRHTLNKHRVAFDAIAKMFDKSANATDLERLVTDFLITINLNNKLSDYDVTDEQFEKIVNHPALNFLPFGSKDYFVSILNDSK